MPPSVTIKKKINEGGMSEIFLGIQNDSAGTPVAIKKIRWKNMSLIEARVRQQIDRFKKWRNNDYEPIFYIAKMDKKEVNSEIQMLQAAQHENVVKFYQDYTKGNFTYIVTELCSFSIDELHEEDTTFPSIPYSLALFLVTPILRALAYIHSKGIVHLDIKPGNILIDVKGIPKLCDFGLAVNMSNDVETSIMGTVGFIAPELYLDSESRFDSKADMFSFGSTILNLIHKAHCRLQHYNDAKAFFGKTLIERMKEKGGDGTAFTRFQYNINSIISDKAHSEYAELAKNFIIYNPAERPTADEAMQIPVLKQHDTAWRTHNELYSECLVLFEKRMKKNRISLELNI